MPIFRANRSRLGRALVVCNASRVGVMHVMQTYLAEGGLKTV